MSNWEGNVEITQSNAAFTEAEVNSPDQKENFPKNTRVLDNRYRIKAGYVYLHLCQKK